MTAEAHTHGAEELCAAGTALYSRALREGRVKDEDAAAVPCLLDIGLLRADPDDSRWQRPVPPSVALPGLLGVSRTRSRTSGTERRNWPRRSHRSWRSTPSGRPSRTRR